MDFWLCTFAAVQKELAITRSKALGIPYLGSCCAKKALC
jgi:hypothetical protein